VRRRLHCIDGPLEVGLQAGRQAAAHASAAAV
jgi:hypothetical protein